MQRGNAFCKCLRLDSTFDFSHSFAVQSTASLFILYENAETAILAKSPLFFYREIGTDERLQPPHRNVYQVATFVVGVFLVLTVIALLVVSTKYWSVCGTLRGAICF